MFKKLDDLSKPTLLSKTGVKEMKTAIISKFPLFIQIEDDVLPRKANISSQRLRSEYKVDIIQVDKEILFFSKQDIVIPHLRLLHKYPDLLPKQIVDAGAISHILCGSDVMAPGLCSPGANLNPAKKDDIVSIYAEGKEHALAIGIMQMSSEQIQTDKKGHAITLLHHLGDALWYMTGYK